MTPEDKGNGFGELSPCQHVGTEATADAVQTSAQAAEPAEGAEGA